MSTTYHVACNGAEIGIFSKEDIIAKLQSGELQRDCLVWTEGMDTWESITTMLPPRLTPTVTAPSASAQNWGPIEAVKTVCWYRYADFEGRASRSEYWYSVLGVFLLFLLYLLVCGLVFGLMAAAFESPAPIVIPMVVFIFAVIYTIVPGISLMVRRLHDINMSGWFYLLNFVPYVGGIIMFVLTLIPSSGPNQWGDGPEGPGPR